MGTLNNDGVGLAPFYEMEGNIPEQIRNEIQEIREKIIVGEIELSPVYKIKIIVIKTCIDKSIHKSYVKNCIWSYLLYNLIKKVKLYKLGLLTIIIVFEGIER